MQVAPVQKELLDFLRTNLIHLESISDQNSKLEYRRLNERLDNWAAKVAVIGQVKAGKSTFLNAFLGQHDFLPSDINPWTSVITNMRINIPGDPETGADFHFFNEDDWNAMLNGTNHVRELAEELLPGFDTELLKKHSLELKERAQRRLGEHYHALLGSKHSHEFVTPDLLRRYVCAGPGSDEGLTRESLGRYAALTREANIFMRIPDFQVPTIVTDTPGVNDPFLVRDEVTCRSLDKSDVFVVVLSAHQALTDVDIGLIRILAQQDGKDVVIFINRIDELEDYDKKYERLIDDVSSRLSKAIPDIKFQILTGSGFMADATLRTDKEGESLCEELDTDTLSSYLESCYGRVPDTRNERLLLGSGIGEVRGTLSSVIDAGLGCNQLSQFTYDMFAQISATSLSTRRECNALREDLRRLQGGQYDKIIASLESDVEIVRDARVKVGTEVENASERLDKTASDSVASLERDLRQIVATFIVNQRASLEEEIIASKMVGQKSYEIDLSDLHIEMEECLVKRFASTRRAIDSTLEACMQQCDEIIQDKLDEEVKNLTTDDLPNETFVTTLAMSKKSLQAHVVSERSWQFWRKRNVDAKETLTAMCKLAGEELRPTLEKLLEVFDDAQAKRIHAGIERIGIFQRMLDGLLADSQKSLKDSTNALGEAAEDPAKLEKFITQLQDKIEELETRLQELDALNLSMSEAPVLKAA